MYMKEDNLYEEEEGKGRLRNQASLGAGIVVFVCMVSLVSWSVYRGCTRGLMREELRWSDPDALPWEEHKWLMYSEKLGGGRPEVFEGQPEILKGLGYKAKLHKKGETCGEIKLGVRLDGTVEGEWSGEFERSEPAMKRYTTVRNKERRYVSNSFRGNIVRTKIYSDEEGQDRSKLYFIARGELLLEEFDYQMGDSHRIRGDVYVTGWMGSEYNVEGKLYVCWGNLFKEAMKRRSARERGEESEELDILAPGTVEVFEWEGSP